MVLASFSPETALTREGASENNGVIVSFRKK
jgi:hypothetical protein